MDKTIDQILNDPIYSDLVDKLDLGAVYAELDVYSRAKFSQMLIDEGIDPIEHMGALIPRNAFGMDTPRAQRIVVTSNIDRIMPYAFYRCTSLNEIIFSNNLRQISEGSFFGCTGLTSIHLSDSVEYVGHEAFRDCMNVKYLRIGPQIKCIGSKAFYGMPNLEGIRVDMPKEQFMQLVHDNQLSQTMFEDDIGYVIHCIDGEVNWDEN